ncbi:hypothetical protein GCM10027168_44260 [Streptomyces capparidis]
MPRGIFALALCLIGMLLLGAPASADTRIPTDERFRVFNPADLPSSPKDDAPKPYSPPQEQDLSQDCAHVMSQLDQHAREGTERVGCVTSRTITSDEHRQISPSALPVLWCSKYDPAIWWYKRFGWCRTIVVTYRIIEVRTGKELGTSDWAIQQELAPQVSAANIKEHIDITLLSQKDAVKTPSINFDSGCINCKSPHVDPFNGYQAMTPGRTIQADMDRSAWVPRKGRATVTFGWEMIFRHPGVADLTTDWAGPEVRCDNEVGGNYGCVVDKYIPTLNIDYQTRQAGAFLVWWGMEFNDEHWGAEGAGEPLERLADEEQSRKNRDLICPNEWVPDLEVPDPSCDEYPFASTYQSAGMQGVEGWRCEQLTSTRVIVDGVPSDWVLIPVVNSNPKAPCIRATTPLGQNSAVGGDLGRFTQEQRLLKKDKYWTSVWFAGSPGK